LDGRFRMQILDAIKEKRTANLFPPDYQAQRMVERAGEKYFELLSAVDADSYNAVQYYAAYLARAGKIKAVVTTNFDQNFERAFTQAGVPFRVYYDEKGFHELAVTSTSAGIPVIKVHGSCSSPASMIDTRKQRLQGRAKALGDALLQLLNEYHFLFAGFSGADFDDDKNYLGIRPAAISAKGFTYLYFPGSEVRESIQELIRHYGIEKAVSVEADAGLYLEDLVKQSTPGYTVFNNNTADHKTIRDRLKEKTGGLEAMDAINMLAGLAESYGDEVSARYLYDAVWKRREENDYKGESFSRFLLNHGRSFVFNFQDKKERANAAGVLIENLTFGNMLPEMEDYTASPAKFNLKHEKNTSPESVSLIGLCQTFYGNPVLYVDFPDGLLRNLRSKPDKTEAADIYYQYAYHALVYNDFEAVYYLTAAINDMDEDFDEPRVSQLLSRRALLYMKTGLPDKLPLAEADTLRARSLAEKYHDPHLLASSALALANLARKQGDFDTAFGCIREAESHYSTLARIPQFIEVIVEYLKIIILGLSQEKSQSEPLYDLMQEIYENTDAYIIDRVNLYEPEYCYTMAMIWYYYTTAPKENAITWFTDAILAAERTRQMQNYEFFRETCRAENILAEVDLKIARIKANEAKREQGGR